MSNRMQRRHFLSTVAGGGAIAAVGCKSTPSPSAISPGLKTGGVRMIPVAAGKYRVWTRRVGDAPIKVLLLHGGPGLNHIYLNCFEDFLPQQGIEFYFYDQLGSHYSDNPDDKTLWTVERFTEEVEEVRKGLGLDNFYLYGQSWGGMLGYEYALKYGSHLKGLVISNMVASVPGYVQHAAKLRAAFPESVRDAMARYEARNDYDNPEYQKVIFENLYAQHLCRLDPWPAPVELSLKFFNQKIYNYMQGPNEFVITGTFKDWDRTRDLKNITTKTLVLGARYDTMDPDEMKRVAAAMPNARVAISERGSHLSLYDDQAWYFDQLIPFFRS
jgi:proline iminopeptidase